MDRDLDDLLAGGALSGRAREEVLARVLDRVAIPREGRRHGAIALLAAGLAACAALVLVVAPRHARDQAFGSRGSAAPPTHVSIVCSEGALEACPRGAHLLFAAAGGAEPGYLTAYAEPVGGGERIWYFSAERTAPRIAPGGPEQPLDRTVTIGAEHAPGAYRVTLLVGARPLRREEALHPDAAPVIHAETAMLQVVP